MNTETGRRVAKKRSGRGHKRERPQAAAPAYITRKIPYFEFLDEEGLIAAPFILGGAMVPVTTAASISQALAEAMMVGAFTQLVRPGAPLSAGTSY